MRNNQRQQKEKSLSSQQQTRNPTTHKKVIFYTPVQIKSQKRQYTSVNINHQKNSIFSNNKVNDNQRSLYNSMHQIQAKKQDLIKHSRYVQARQLHKVVNQLERERAKTQIKKLISGYKDQRKDIKKAHLQQMKKFQAAWENYFIGLRAKQQITLLQFRKSKQTNIRFVQNQLIQKCKSLKLNKGQLRSLQKKEKQLIVHQRYDQLILLKGDKKRLVLFYIDSKKLKLLKQLQQKVYTWAKQEQDMLKTYHTKKYNALVSRIQQMHNDKYRQYQRQGCRLRQKYHNVLQKLQHSQKVDINQILGKYPFAKQIRKQRSFTISL